MGIAKVTRNYQVTIPKDVRRLQSINVGDTVLFTIGHSNVDFLKLDEKRSLKELAGSWKGKVNKSGVEYVRELRLEWNKRAKRLGL